MVAGAAALFASVGVASAEEQSSSSRQDRSDSAPYISDGGSAAMQRQIARSTFSAEPEGTDPQNLPAKRENVDLISRLTFRGGPGGSIAPGQIADVAVHKNAAYLMSWSEPNCRRGGFFSVDISDPANPRELRFVPALPNTYHGEGAHAISVDTAAFRGDLLVTNNEPCTATGSGGFDLYDVSDPANPRPLVQGAGDRGREGALTGTRPQPTSSHSSFLWQDDGRAFVVIVDNVEAHDVDIFEVTDPRNPRPVGEFDLVALAKEQGADLIGGEQANQGQVFQHDMVVKEINGRQTLLSSYWDAGYVKLDVEDPANPRYIADSDFVGRDPETGAVTREGNAHQAEFSADNRYFLAADEDFAPFRADEFRITTGPNAGEYRAVEVSGGTSVAALPDGRLNGPVVYGGYGCPDPDGAGPEEGSDPIPRRDQVNLPALRAGEEAIVVLQRGPVNDPDNPEDPCFPGEKAAEGQAAGYDAVLIVNRHLGSAGEDAPFCGSGGYPPGVSVVTLCTTHTAFHRMFNETPNYSDYRSGDEPARGQVGERVRGTATFDGWGYAHLYENNNGKIREVDTYSIQESRDPRFSFGFGDLSIHEWATDPEVPLAYAAYYAGGLRVASFGPEGLIERGAFIDDRGSNFWGVEQFTDRAGNRLIALSDRDFGLYIVQYTGPGAPQPRGSTPAETPTPTTPTPAAGPCDAPGNLSSRRPPQGFSVAVSRTGGFARNQTGIVKRAQRRSAGGRSLLVTSRGRMTPPAGRGVCGGRVLVRIKSGKLTISSRTVNLRADGTYRARTRFKLPRRITQSRLSVQARFQGNSVYLPSTAGKRTVRALR